MRNLNSVGLTVVCLLMLGETIVSAREEIKITALDGSSNGGFGTSVEIFGKTAIVGAPTNSGARFGSASLYDAVTGQLLHQLESDGAAAGDNFGRSVGIFEDTAIVGASGRHADGSSGAAYLFDTLTGTQIDELRAPTDEVAIGFGGAVAIHATTAIVGAIGGSNDPGAAYVFDTQTGDQLFKLTSDDGNRGDRFGSSVAIRGNRAVVGARFDSDNGLFAGSAYVFDLDTGEQLHKLIAPEPLAADDFGVSVALNANTIVVGASNTNSPAVGSGSAYLFDVSTGDLLFELTASVPQAFSRLGTDVAIDDEVALVGAPAHSGVGVRSGAAFAFDLQTGKQIATYIPSDTTPLNTFGNAVSMSDGRIFIGTARDDDLGENAGAAYLFLVPEPNTAFLLLAAMFTLAATRRETVPLPRRTTTSTAANAALLP